MNCCTNTYDLGCFDSCDTIELPFEYTQNGTYKIEFETQFRFKIYQTGILGEPIQLDLAKFPEDSTLTLRIINPDGTGFEYAVGSSFYDCFRMTTSIYRTIDFTPTTIITPTICCKPKIYAYTGVDNATLNYSDWSAFGAVPTLEVYYFDGSNYITIPIQPVYDSMPNPTTITINIGGIPTDVWYIKIS
jgi:hypothetical protein